MNIKIPGHKSVKFHPDIHFPGDGPVEVSEVAAAGGPTGDYLLVDAGGDYLIIDAGGDWLAVV